MANRKHGGFMDKPVAQYEMVKKPIKVFNSASEAGRETGIGNPNIIRCCNGLRKTAGGFVWRYIEITPIPPTMPASEK